MNSNLPQRGARLLALIPAGTVALATVLAAGAAGCNKQQHTTGRWAQAPQPVATAPSSTPAGQANHAPRGQRGFDPLWIESAAAAERSPQTARGWEPYRTISASVQAPQPGTPVSPHQPSPTDHHFAGFESGGLDFDGAAAARGSWIDDGPEGLAHVTFAPEGADFDPAIAADGQFMVFASTQHRPTADIYLKRTNGRTITQLTADPAQDVMPAISPDGRRVAYASNRRGNWDVFVMSVNGGQSVQFTSDSTHELHPTWSPDGSRIAFCRLGQTSGRWEIWVAEASGGTASEFIGYGLFPEWCPVAGGGENGRDQILFQRSKERGDRAFSVWTIDYKPGDASNPTEIVSSPQAALVNARWSKDGQWIAYAAVPRSQSGRGPAHARTRPASDLWLTSVDGASRVMLTSGKHLNLMPAWAPEGRLYFVSDRSGVNNIWSLGTEKAIAAATGNRPGNPATASHPGSHPGSHAEPAADDADMASVPTDEEHPE